MENYYKRINEKVQEILKDFCSCELDHDCTECSCNKFMRKEGFLGGYYVCGLLFKIADDLLSQEE